MPRSLSMFRAGRRTGRLTMKYRRHIRLVEVGSRVGVPFGGQVECKALLLSLTEFPTSLMQAQAARRVLDHTPPLSPDLIELAQWVSDKYCCALTTWRLQVMIPAALKGKAEYERYD